MSEYCNDCEIWVSPGTLYKQVAPGKYESVHVQRVKLCPKHAAVDELIAELRVIAELPIFHGKCNCRYCTAFRGARAVLAKAEPKP